MGDNKKHTFLEVIDAFSRTNYQLLSSEEEYHNCMSPMRFICPKHRQQGEQTINLSHLLQGRGCKYCGEERRRKLRNIPLDKHAHKKLCESKGFIYIDTIRKDGKIVITFICEKHIELGQQSMTVHNMEREIKGCQYCCGKNIPEWYIMQQLHKINPHIELLEPYQGLSKSIAYHCKKHDYYGKNTVNQMIKGHVCRECGREKLSNISFLSFDDVSRKITVKNPHIQLLNYNGMSEFAECLCLKHNQKFQKRPYILFTADSGCHICYKERIRATQGLGSEEFITRITSQFPQIQVRGQYINNTTPIEMYCSKHDYSFKLTPSAMLSRHSCCPKSRVNYKEEQMCQLLESWGFQIERQKSFIDCGDIRQFAFDAYIKGFDTVVEYQGEQHYYPVRYSPNQTLEDAEQRLQYTQLHDSLKQQYTQQHHINLIQVPYWEYETMDIYLFDQLSKLGVIKEDIA